MPLEEVCIIISTSDSSSSPLWYQVMVAKRNIRLQSINVISDV